MSVAQDNTLCETPSVAVVLIDAGSLFAEEELDVCKVRSRKARYFGLEVGKAGSRMG